MMNDGVIQHVRVGAGAGLGARELSRANSEVVGMLGSGGMARTFLEALCCVRGIRKVKVYSPTTTNRDAYADEMRARPSVEIVAVDDPQEAFRDVDIVSSCTNSMSPVIVGEWSQPEMHVIIVNAFEIGREGLDRCDEKIRQDAQELKVRENIYEIYRAATISRSRHFEATAPWRSLPELRRSGRVSRDSTRRGTWSMHCRATAT